MNAKFGDAKYYQERSRELLNNSKNGEALNAANKALEKDPKNPHNWWLRGSALCGLGRNEEALEAAGKAIDIDPEDAAFWWLKGSALRGLGRLEEALDAANKTVDLNPKDATNWWLKGTILRSLGRDREALDAADNAVEINPKDSTNWWLKGTILRGLGQDKEALDAANKAVETNPKDSTNWWLKGSILRSLGRDEEALQAARLISNNYPHNNSPSILRHGITHFLVGMFVIVTLVSARTFEDDPLKYLILVTGGILVLAGFALAIASFPIPKYSEIVTRWDSRLFFVFYAVALTQLFPVLYNFYLNHSISLVVITALFILLILISLGFMVAKLQNNIRPMLIACVLFDIIAIVTILLALNDLKEIIYQVVTYIVLSLILLFLAWTNSKKKSNIEKRSND